jgi:hypothetical protein
MKNIVLNVLSILLFSIGVIAGTAFVLCATWADVESFFYGFNQYGNKITSTMHCPILMTDEETGVITASFKNTTNQLIRPTVSFQASSEWAFRTLTNVLSLEPGQSETLQWEVTKNDLALNYFIFAQIATFSSYPMKDVEQTCGIMVLDLTGITGKQLTIYAIIVSLAGLVVGCLLWNVAHHPLRYRFLDAMRAMLTISVVVLAGIVSVFLAWWPLGILLLVLTLILIGVIVGNFLQKV